MWCFPLLDGAPLKGGIGGVPLEVDVEKIKRIPGVVDSWKCSCYINGEGQISLSVLLCFDFDSSPQRDSISYQVRAHIQRPL